MSIFYNLVLAFFALVVVFAGAVWFLPESRDD